MLKLRLGTALVIVATSLLMAPATGRCQTGRKSPGTDPLARVKVGDWIQLEGTIQGNSPVACIEVRLLTGDFLDDDWSVQGTVRTIDPARREFVIAGLRVHVTENTTFENPSGTFRGFSDLRPGILVEVEGTYLKNGRFLAAEVDDESDEIARAPAIRNRIRVVGRAERVDIRKRLIAAVGTVFQLTEKTQVRSVIE